MPTLPYVGRNARCYCVATTSHVLLPQETTRFYLGGHRSGYLLFSEVVLRSFCFPQELLNAIAIPFATLLFLFSPPPVNFF
jgi:hypothetical protein